MTGNPPPLLHLLLALLVAVTPMQGAFAALVLDSTPVPSSTSAAGSMGSERMADMAMHHGHHQPAADSGSNAASASDAVSNAMADGACDCCPEGQPGGCKHCAVTHCMTDHCGSSVAVPVVLLNVFDGASKAWLQPFAGLLLAAIHATPFRPPRA